MYKTKRVYRMIMINIFLVVIAYISIISFTVSDNELKDGWWKYGSGQHIGDVLDFRYLTVISDTIYRSSKKIGVIVKREESWFGLSSRKIFIQPLIETTDPIEENFKMIKANFPDSYEKYESPSGNIGIYHQK